MSDGPAAAGFSSPSGKAKLLSTLRWILFLPAAYAAGVLAYLAFRMSFAVLAARPIPVIDELVAMGLGGFAFVVAGSGVAPRARKVVAVILLVVYAVQAGMVLFVGLQTRAGFERVVAIAGLVAGILGAGIGFFVGGSLGRSQEGH